MEDRTIRHYSLKQQLIDKIMNRISNGTLRPGDRIVEAELGEKFGISRAPVREALNSLSTNGILNVVPYKGTYVSSLDKDEVWELFTLRAHLESFAVDLIFKEPSLKKDLILKLNKIYLDLKEIVESKNLHEIAQIDMEFHEAIVKSTGHGMLYESWLTLKYKILMYFILTIEKRYSSFDDFTDLHKGLISIIEYDDADLAKIEIKKHILIAGENLINFI